MKLDFWTLPGPSSFLARVASSLGEGLNVVLQIPRNFPQLRDLRQRLKEQSVGDFTALTPEPGADPLETLYREFTHQRPPPGSDPLGRLVRCPDFEGRTLWVEVAGDGWAPWSDFIQRYCRASKDLSFAQRTSLVLVAPGVSELALKPEVNLQPYRWEGQVHEHDLFFYGLAQAQTRSDPPLVRELVAAVASEVATYDPRVVDILVFESLDTLADPQSFLAARAGEFGWDPAAEATWALGSQDGGRVHPVVLALQAPREIRRRVWRGQLRALFPRLEQARIRLAEQNRHHLQLPFETPYGPIKDWHELELGHLAHKLRGRDNHAHREAELLRVARNELAHLRPLGASTLQQVLPLLQP
ncbi:hypothetical protein [Calidithermus chliarophilus]|uniref:hypothetical protein n=1 Tax=Calidithermus chliarophilus TaxID=52023 RepID=UPI00048707FD|nr:hypothetical protein [Calidithermus chliarophilus]